VGAGTDFTGLSVICRKHFPWFIWCVLLGWHNLATMGISEWIGENLGALIVAAVASVFASLGGLLLTILVGVKFFRDEWSYGIPLLFGIPVALVAGVAAFLVVFRKLR